MNVPRPSPNLAEHSSDELRDLASRLRGIANQVEPEGAHEARVIERVKNVADLLSNT